VRSHNWPTNIRSCTLDRGLPPGAGPGGSGSAPHRGRRCR
jgi:hypothetical protein